MCSYASACVALSSVDVTWETNIHYTVHEYLIDHCRVLLLCSKPSVNSRVNESPLFLYIADESDSVYFMEGFPGDSSVETFAQEMGSFFCKGKDEEHGYIQCFINTEQNLYQRGQMKIKGIVQLATFEEIPPKASDAKTYFRVLRNKPLPSFAKGWSQAACVFCFFRFPRSRVRVI